MTNIGGKSLAHRSVRGLGGFAIAALVGFGMICPPISAVLAGSAKDGAVANASASQTHEYRLNIRDKVRIQVFEWRPAKDELFTWTALNQIYTVDPSGELSLPLIGQVKASGYSTGELSTLISRQLADRLSLAALPDVTVEVTEFRPIFVTGHVEKSGEYPYSPGMTVLQAVSLGGGLYRTPTGLRLEREYLTVSGDYERAVTERDRLIARKARLQAELASSDRIAFPTELVSDRRTQTSSLLSKEQSVFELRQNAYHTQIEALDQLQEYLEREVDTIGKRLESHKKQIDLVNAELAGLKPLTDKGLVTQPRILALQRNLAELQGEELRIESDRTRAMQDVSRTKISKIEVDNKRANDLTVDLQQTDSRLEEVTQQAAVNAQLLVETKSQAAGAPSPLISASLDSGKAHITRPQLKYTITRQSGDDVAEIDATDKTIIQPGDTVTVELAMPAMAIDGPSLNVDSPILSEPAPTLARQSVDDRMIKSPTSASLMPINSIGDYDR
jgi:polysaccharide export outer membrane protein/exopolysaccharide production protein ExoF